LYVFISPSSLAGVKKALPYSSWPRGSIFYKRYT